MSSLPHRTDSRGFDLARWENPDHWPREEETESDPRVWPAWTDARRGCPDRS
jgi:hypothetical protein